MRGEHDYLIGEPGLRRRGLGAGMIAALVRTSWAAFPQADAIVVPVAAANIAPWQALERAGFDRVAEGELEPDNPVDGRHHFIYAIQRPRSEHAEDQEQDDRHGRRDQE